MNKKYFFFIICGLFIYTNKTPEVSNYQHKGKKKKRKKNLGTVLHEHKVAQC